MMIFVFVVFFASGVRYRESPFYAYIVGNYVKKYYMEIFGIHLWFFFYFNMLLGGWMDEIFFFFIFSFYCSNFTTKYGNIILIENMLNCIYFYIKFLW